MYIKRKGFTLIEVLIAMLALLIGLLGSLAGVMGALEHNLTNDFRNEAIRIAQEILEDDRNKPYGDPALLDNDTAAPNGTVWPAFTVLRQIRKVDREFEVTRTVWDNFVRTGGIPIKRVRISVSWQYRDKTRAYSVETILREPT